MNVIESFLKQYSKEYDYYYELAQYVANACETLLLRNGIYGVITYRAKRPDSLRQKLIKRNETQHYQSIEDIYEDIADLAGVRISTYFPGDREEIASLMKAEFITDTIKYFPNQQTTSPFNFRYKKLFAGYDAIHYRVRIKDVRLEDNKKRFALSPVEIQIASMLMHAWAEVEHDLAYKPKIGSLSEAEYRILDELNGMVLSGEFALERLQKAFNQRISQIEHSFNNHYELAALIRGKLKMDANHSYMGRADILYSFLQKTGMDKPQDILNYIEEAGKNKAERTIVRKIVDLILEDYPQYYHLFIEAKYEVYGIAVHLSEESLGSLDRDYTLLAKFVELWAELQVAVRSLYDKHQGVVCDCDSTADSLECRMIKMLQLVDMKEEYVDEARYLYNLRNNVLFASELPEEEVLKNGCKHLQKLISYMKEAVQQ